MNGAILKKRVEIFSPAKINFFLEVLGKRPDGYHNIQTVLQAIDLCDRLAVRSIPDGIQVRTDAKGLPVDERNLCFRAAQLFLRDKKINSGVQIRIQKKIPIGGGLGGGSSNAACTLLALDKLFKTRSSAQQLLDWAGALGSDVSFFLRGVPALVSGRGTKLRPLGDYFPVWLALVFPNVEVPSNKTARVYEALKMGLTVRPVPVTITTAAIETKSLNALSESLFNRLEEVVLKQFPLVSDVKHFMRKNGGFGVLVSGAGPTVFGIVSSRMHGTQLAKKISRRFRGRVRCTVTKTLAGTPAPVLIQ